MQEATTSLIVLKELSGHSAVQLDTLQSWLAPHITLLTQSWFSIWCLTALVLFVKLIYEYRDQKNGH